MKKNHAIIYGLLTVSILVSTTLTGCQSSKSRQMETQYRAEGIKEIGNGAYDKAIDDFNKALKQAKGTIDEEELDITYYKAQAQILANDTKGALATYKALISYDKKNEKAYYLRGKLYLSLSKQTEAEHDFAKAVQVSKKNYDLNFQIYSDLNKAGFAEDAQAYLKSVTKFSGKTANDYAMRGKAYLLLKDYDNAKAQLQKAIDKKSKEAQVYMASLYQAQGDTKKAQQMYEAYVKENKNDGNALASLGAMLLEQGDYDNAITYIKMALKTDTLSDKQTVLKNQILAYEYKSDFTTAKTLMAAYVKAYPNDAQAVRENEFLQTR